MHSLEVLHKLNEEASRRCCLCDGYHCTYPGAERIVRRRKLDGGEAVWLCHRCAGRLNSRLGVAVRTVEEPRVEPQWSGEDVGERLDPAVAEFRVERRRQEVA